MRLLHSREPASEAEVAAWYAYGPGATLRANMVMGADGLAVDLNGSARGLSGSADLWLLGFLRGLADAVVVAAGTIRAEGYNPIRARQSLREYRAAAGLAEHPVLVVVTRTPTLDPGLAMFTEAPVRPIVICASDNGSLADVAEVIECPDSDGRVDVAAAKSLLVERGLRRLLTEGGPHFLGSLLAAGVLDEYCVTLSPQLHGGSERLRPVMGATTPTGYLLHSAAVEGDFVFLRYRRDGA